METNNLTQMNPIGIYNNSNMLLEIRNLKKYFPISTGFIQSSHGQVKAVDSVNLKLNKGEVLGLVGESGCGKTTLGRCIVRLYDPLSGEILFRTSSGEVVNLAKMSSKELLPYRREFQMIFQDPFSSLDPRRTVFDTISEPIRANKLMTGRKLEEYVIHLMESVGLQTEYLRRYPHAFSGGQRQRVGIARSLATNPRLIVADESVSALDVSVQAQILNLLKDLQVDFDLSYLFIAHDLNVVRYISNRVAVMYVGRMMELASTPELFSNPKHPYTEALLSAIPKSAPDDERHRIILQGEIPNPANPPKGCYFHPRCRYAKDICKKTVPEWKEVSPEHYAACHFSKDLSLQGIV